MSLSTRPCYPNQTPLYQTSPGLRAWSFQARIWLRTITWTILFKDAGYTVVIRAKQVQEYTSGVQVSEVAVPFPEERV